MIKKLIKRNRQRLADECPDIHKMKYLSPAMYIMTKQVLDGIQTYLKPKLLDIGCGHMTLKADLEKKVGSYDTLDIDQRVENVTFIGSVLDMNMIENDSYQSAVSFAVLEHVPQPFKAVEEINRILKKDGIFMFTVPHVSRLHEIPHDYFRFTEFGLKQLLETQGFEILELQRSGTMISYFMHQISTILIGLTWHIPGIKHLIFALNKFLIVLPFAWLDQKLMHNSLTPLNYYCVARKISNTTT